MTGKVEDPQAFCYGPAEGYNPKKAEAKMANLCGVCNWIVDDPEKPVEVCPACGAKAYYVPILHSGETKKEGFAGTMRHKDFVRIHGEFVKYYCKDKPMCTEADDEYYAWLGDLGLDETKPYGEAKESFTWSKNMLRFIKEDKENKYYEVIVGLPITSMNNNVYSVRDLIAASCTLEGKSPNLNHKAEFWFSPKNPQNKWGNLTVVEGKYEDGASGALLKVPKNAVCPICNGALMTELIDKKHIVNVSLEGTELGAFEYGDPPFSLLTKDVLPGIPMARIFPMEEYLSEALSRPKTLKGKKERFQVTGITMPKKKEDQNPCPEGQERDETGQCVPTKGTAATPVAGSASGTPAAQDTSSKPVDGQSLAKEADDCMSAYTTEDGTFTGGFDGCVQAMQYCKGLPEENAKKLCAFIGRAAGKIASFTKEQRDILIEVLSDAIKEGLLPTSEQALLISSLQVKALQAEKRAKDAELQCKAKVEGMDLSLAETNEALSKESVAKQKAEGRIIELENRNRQLEAQMKDAIEQKIQDGQRIKEWERKAQDRNDELAALKVEHEKHLKLLSETDEKYRDALKQNLDLSKRLTGVNEEYLGAMKKTEELEEKNKKAKRLAKFIVKQ